MRCRDAPRTRHEWRSPTTRARERAGRCIAASAPTTALHPRAARGGFVTCDWSGVHYVAVDGHAVLLDERRLSFVVSPDGRMAAYSSRYHPASTVVVEIPSGDEILRVVHAEIPAAAELPPAMTSWTVWAEEWTSDSSAVVLNVIDDDTGYGGPTADVIARLDGALHLVPCEVNDYTLGRRCYAPDGRHVVRVRSDSGGYYWRYIDVIDSETEEVLWSVESPVRLRPWDWEWATPDHFAWADALLPRVYPSEFSPDARVGKNAQVSVLDIRTGETELLDIDEYLARFHSPRATTTCPENPGHSCRILLDGEVVGGGALADDHRHRRRRLTLAQRAGGHPRSGARGSFYTPHVRPATPNRGRG